MRSFFEKKLLAFFVFLSFFSSCVAEHELLKTDDIQKVMSQLLLKHVDKNRMTGDILHHAILYYIDNFDPQRVYLLDSEVRPYLRMSAADLAVIQSQYAKNDYAIFKKLDALFSSSIERMREVRAKIERTPAPLFFAAERAAIRNSDDEIGYEKFSMSEQELNQRAQELMITYLQEQIQKYGRQDVMANKPTVLKNYEEDIRDLENPYLYVNDEGKALNPTEKENLFALHILKSIAKSLDSHTSVYNPEEAYDMRVRLEKGLRGVGVKVKKAGEGVFIEKIYTDSPAARAGTIQVGDRLVEINKRSAHSIAYEDLLDMLRGDNATKVHLMLKRKGGIKPGESQQLYEVDLAPEVITVNEDRVTTSYVPFEDGIIGTIVLKSFYKGVGDINSEKDVIKGIAELKKAGKLKGLILDLRGNTGGFLTQAVKVAGLFITNGVVVISKYSTGEEHFYRDMDGKISYEGPLIVLTSKTTASAAEIVAQALQDYGVAVIVGDPQTFGKGTIQSQTVTGKDSAASYFKVTVGKYYTVSGKTPQRDGVKADVVVPSELSYEEIGEEYIEDALPSDKISASFSDQLADVDSGMKAWYMHYYMPTLQKKQQKWRQMIPALQSQSSYRLHSNPEYQRYLSLLDDRSGQSPRINPNTIHDLQHREAINIVKDMIIQENKINAPKKD